MTQGQLVNSAERMSVVYGPAAFSVNQQWVASPVRLEQIAPLSWEIVSEAMAVAREVSRFGVRFQFAWKVDDAAEAERRIAASGLFAETELFRTMFGAPKNRGWWAMIEGRASTLRVALDAYSVEVVGVLPADLEGLAV